MLFLSTNYTLCNVICNQQGNLCTSLDIENKFNMNGKQKLIQARVSFYIVAYITYVKYEMIIRISYAPLYLHIESQVMHHYTYI